ncbi:LamG-like jellyroll fold domain-containing protein [Conexibacter arvalis]|uniref:3',5'-cyclic AMP phosphodiesterase CpdA n=1 Tax=Conexibacter arvalis TaxID=912552 RepID=A0A840IHA1_9ACTN|nr:LamG-like jellyroll fold domain-containing protein [Conexibacter arvalis]MBB4663444.1 3',5'-cyclic AMP phosphodiesterase CpdA [Conexibacter arvalis]
MRSPLPRRVRGRFALLTAAAACALTPLLSPPLVGDAAAAEGDRSSFLLGVLPDTQFYSRYSTAGSGELFMDRYGTEPYAVQTRWLADNRDELRIPFVTHLGDVVDRHGQTQEWEVADEAMRTLEQAGLPYSILAGNHDVVNGCSGVGCRDDSRNLANENFLRYFPASRAAEQASFGGRDESGFHEWHTFTAEGRTFLALALSWEASDRAIQWARDVIAAHPRLPVILTTHNILAIDSDAVTAVETGPGLRLWNELIRDNDQIFLTINGHNHGSAHLRKTNDFGHSVDQIVWDYQMAYMGGNAYLGLMEFDFTNDRIDTAVVSPWVRLKPTDTLIPEYDQAVKTGPNENLRLAIDWDERFSRFADPVAAPAPSHGSLLDAAKASVLDGYDEPEVRQPSLPHDERDYPKVDGTLAHWRFDASAAGALQPGAVGAKDVEGGADMRRAPLDAEDVVGAELGDLTITRDHHALSSNGASACFANVGRRISYMNTAADAAVNRAWFRHGYTIETFIKLDADWSSTDNAWMGALTREGSRRDVPGMVYPGWSWDEPVFTLAISNLREVQWNAAGADPIAERPNWSGEIMADRWMHVATVNDPIARTTTMYVDGAPVLRNAVDTVGLSTADLPWRIGSGMTARRTVNGWSGCIGETRIVDRPLPRDQWLTTRTHVAPEPEEPGPGPEQPGPQQPGPEQPGPQQPGPQQPGPGGTPPTTEAPGPGAVPRQPAGKPKPSATRVRALRLQGRQLRVRVSGRARLRVALRRCSGRRCARRPTRTLTATARRAGTVTVRLPRRLPAGRYRVAVTARSSGGTTRRTATVRVKRAARTR